MEFRVRLKVPGLGLADEQGWEPLIRYLEEHQTDDGPVLAFENGVATVTFAIGDAADAAGAARIAMVNLLVALRHSGRGKLKPSVAAVDSIDAPVRDEVPTGSANTQDN